MAKKRGNGEGTIRRRNDGRWEARYTVHTFKGPKQKSVFGKTRKEVNEKLTKVQADRNQGLVFDAENLTLGEYLDTWLNNAVRDSVRQSTFERNQQIVQGHITPALGRVKLDKLTPAHVQSFYREKLDSGLSPATVNKVHTVLHKALAQAVRWLMVPRNVTEAVQAPRPNPEEIRPLNKEQVGALLEAASGDPLEALYRLAISTGMRQGELLALKWEDVELDWGLVRVWHTLTRAKGRFSLGETKTKGSRRTARLTKDAIESLNDHYRQQLEKKMKHRASWEEYDFVFTTQTGNLINPTNLRNLSFKPLLKTAGIPEIRFHDLRHTTATLLLKQEVAPKHVSELLGHATVAMTLNTYSHILPDMGDRVVDAMEAALA
jgi:integrase